MARTTNPPNLNGIGAGVPEMPLVKYSHFFSSQRSKLDEAGLLDANAVFAGVVGRSPRCWEVTAGVDERLELRCGCTWRH